MVKMLLKKPVKILFLSVIVIVAVIVSLYILLETKYQKSLCYEKEQDYISAYNEIEDIGFFKDINNQFLNNTVFLSNYALESSDFSVLQNAEISNFIIPSFINYDAGIAACVLYNLNLPYQIEYVNDKSFSCNMVVDQKPCAGSEVNSGEKIILVVNSYWGTNSGNINFGYRGISKVAESGEWLYYIAEEGVYRCRFDFTDKTLIYKSENNNILAIHAAKGYIFLFEISHESFYNNKIVIIKPDNTILNSDTGIVTFLVINNELLYIKEENSKDVWYKTTFDLTNTVKINTFDMYTSHLIYNDEACVMGHNNIIRFETNSVYDINIEDYNEIDSLINIGDNLYTFFTKDHTLYIYENNEPMFQTEYSSSIPSYILVGNNIYIADSCNDIIEQDKTEEYITVFNILNHSERKIKRPMDDFMGIFQTAGDYIFTVVTEPSAYCFNVKTDEFVNFKD